MLGDLLELVVETVVEMGAAVVERVVGKKKRSKRAARAKEGELWNREEKKPPWEE